MAAIRNHQDCAHGADLAAQFEPAARSAAACADLERIRARTFARLYIDDQE